MRLQRITLRNFRGVSESVVEFATGVTIVAGPNEVGKTSIAEAISLVRSTKHSSRAAAIKALQPVGRDVGPEVELELTTGGHTVRIFKRWIRNAATELVISGVKNEQLSGDEAHERFTALLAETMDVDLLDALEIVQGSSLDAAELVGIRALNQALDTSSAPVADHDELLLKIDREYAQFFTGTGRPTGEYVRVDKEIKELTETEKGFREQSREMDALTDDHRRERAQLEEDRDSLARAEENLTDCQARDDALVGLREAVKTAGVVAEQSAVDVRTALAAVESRQELIDDVDERAENLTRAQEQVELHQGDETRLLDQAQELKATVDQERQRREKTRELAREAASAVNHAVDRDAYRYSRRRLTEAEAAQQHDLDAARIIGNIQVDTELLERITTLATEVDVARSARESAASSVTVSRLGEPAVVVAGTPVEGEQTLPVTEPVTIEIPDVARVEVRPGTPSADLDRRVRDAQENLRSALDEGDVTSLDEARNLASARSEAEAERRLARQALTSALAGESVEALKEQVATLAARIGLDAGEAASLGDTAQSTEDPDAPAHTDPGANVNIDSLREAANEAASAAEEAENALREAEQAAGEHGEQLAAIRGELIRAEAAHSAQRHEQERAVQRVQHARTLTSDEEVKRALTTAQEAQERAQKQLTEAEEALAAADPESIEMALTNARELSVSSAERLEETTDRLRRVEALLEDRAKLGIYDKLAAAEADLEHAQGTYAQLHRRAQAARLLREVMARHRDEAHEQYVAPFTERINSLGRRVFGPDFTVDVSPDLLVRHRTLDGITVPFESLSAGAKEQLGLLGRLAAAQLVDPEDGAPLVLDDALGFADPTRLNALGIVLNEVGKRAQIIILTCQPARFSHIGGAKMVHLPTV